MMTATIQPVDRRPLRVLIVDDEPRLRELLSEVVSEMGFVASAARSGEEAVRLLEEANQTDKPFDVILLDLDLPAMSGMELFERVRDRFPSTQVIVLTGFGDLAAAQRAIRLEVVEFLSKPFHLIDIDRALNEARRRCELRVRPSLEVPNEADDSAVSTLAASEYRQIVAALEHHGHNRTAAAAALGISRRTLHYRLAQYRRFGVPDNS